MLNNEQIVESQKAQLAALFDLSNKAMASIEKLAELNLQASRATLADSASQAQALLSVKDVQELMALQSSLLQPLAEKAATYSRNLYDIASSVGSEITKVAEAKAAEAQKQFVAAVDSAVKNAPQGSEAAVAAVKTAISSATSAMQTMQNAVKQVTEQAEANFTAATNNAINSTKAPAKARKGA